MSSISPNAPKMSSKTTKDGDKDPPLNQSDTPVPESKPTSNGQVPTPPQSHHDGDHDVAEDDYSDALSADSQHRRFPRGGRKQKQKQTKPPAQRLQSVSEYELPTSRRRSQPQDEKQDDFDDEEYEDEAPPSPLLAPPEADPRGSDYDDDALKKARGSRPKARPPQPRARKRSTGISSFSVERPRGGGRKPPISVSVERPGEKSKGKSKAKARNKEVAREPEEGSKDEESEDEEEEKRKPVQIRLDLNLELEILLKAKIKGDITITFLE